MDVSDSELLESYVARRDEDSFQQLVDRHLSMVYSVALRVAGDSALAQEIAQSAFLSLAQDAGCLGQETVIAGWLHHKTRHLAMTAARSERRRRNREGIAATMNPPELESQVIAEQLESAMDELDHDDRNALVLRFLEDRNLRDVGTELGVGADAARMRVNRALERLRGIFARRGIAGTASAVIAAMGASAHAAVPAGLGTSITSAALSGAAIATTATLTTQAAALAMKMINLKTAVTVVAAATLAGTTTYLVREMEASRLRQENQLLSASNARLTETLSERPPLRSLATTPSQNPPG